MRTPAIRSITTRIVMLITAAAVLPLLLFAFVSVRSLRQGTEQSVVQGNLNVATRAAEQVASYVNDSISVLRAIGAELNGTRLAPWQQDRVAKNFVLEFPEFREISVFAPDGSVIATSRVGPARLEPPAPGTAASTQVAPITIDDDLLPTTTVSIPIPAASGTSGGWIVGEIRLEELWRMVDRIRVGEQGYALVVSADGRLVAHGDPNEKRYIASGEKLPEHDLAETLRAGGAPSARYEDALGEKTLAAGALVRPFNWAVIVEQPIREAFATAHRLERQLTAAILIALFITVMAGTGWSRPLISRIFALRRGTEALAAGRLDERVSIGGRDELRGLADAFNTMADRLVELQETLRRQERQATFGRVAAGLVHDLSHPVQNIANSCRLLFHSWDDADFRVDFRRTIEHEMQAVKNVLEDLKNIARPIPLERGPIDLAQEARDAAEGMRAAAVDAGVALRVDNQPSSMLINGNGYALGRVYRNLIQNAIQATAPGGAVTVRSSRENGWVRVQVADTGTGIAPERLQTIFEDYFTTRKRGLGLGLAISRRLVEQLDGTIAVESEVGKGTVFTVSFPELRG